MSILSKITTDIGIQLTARTDAKGLPKSLLTLAASKTKAPIVGCQVAVSGENDVVGILLWDAEGGKCFVPRRILIDLAKNTPVSSYLAQSFFKVSNKFREKKNPRGLFRFVDLFSRILPPKVWAESFEPYFEDSKAAYLLNRRRFQGRFERKLVALWFLIWMLYALIQSFWAMCDEKLKKAFWAALGGAVVWFKR
jgi:hypothetical protein